MTTPPPDDPRWSDPSAPRGAEPESAPEVTSVERPAGGVAGVPPEPAEPFDPYRYGLPTHPVPPEYAPPGYTPPAPPPQGLPPGQPYPYPGHSPYPGPYGPSGASGQPYPYPPPQYLTQYPQPATGNGKATAGLVLGIVSIVLFWTTIFDAIPVILGLIFGFLGLKEANRTGRSRGVAIAGIVCGFVGAAIAIGFTAWIFHRIQPCLNSYTSGSTQFNSCVRHHV